MSDGWANALPCPPLATPMYTPHGYETRKRHRPYAGFAPPSRLTVVSRAAKQSRTSDTIYTNDQF